MEKCSDLQVGITLKCSTNKMYTFFPRIILVDIQFIKLQYYTSTRKRID